MMDLVRSSSASGGNGCAGGGELFDLLNPQDQHSHGGSSNNVSDMTKKQEISSSYDFQSVRADGSGNHSSGTNLDGVARNLESGGSVLGSDTMKFSKLLECHEQQKVSCEMGRNAYDVATVREIDQTMKKYADNILHTLEGVSSRLVQLESKAQQLETSVDELMNNSGSANGKLSQLENILREVQTGIQVLRNKQENFETQSQHSKLQKSLKQDQTPSPPENSDPMVSQQATQPSQQTVQPPMPPISATPLQARISLSSPPPHSHHAPNKSLSLQSQNHQLPQYPPQTPSPPQKPPPKVYPHIICRPDTIHNERSNAIKRKFSSSYAGEECVEVVHIGKRNGKRIGGKRWDENDQVNLAKAWSCISNAARNGVNSDEKSFWRGVMKEYNANYCPAGFRSMYALKNYWKLLKKQCFLWKKALSDFNFQTGGDSASNDLIKDVKTKFKSLNNGRKFDYKVAYEILKECPKWSAIEVDNMDLQPSAKRRTSADTSQESSEASMPSGSNNANTPTSDTHSRSPHKFILEESNEQSSILSLETQEKKEHLQETSQDMDSLPVMICDVSELTPEPRVLSS